MSNIQVPHKPEIEEHIRQYPKSILECGFRDHAYDPYIMVYDKPNAPVGARRLQRWVNNKIIFRSCDRFEDYINV